MFHPHQPTPVPAGQAGNPTAGRRRERAHAECDGRDREKDDLDDGRRDADGDAGRQSKTTPPPVSYTHLTLPTNLLV
ncbi:hypothetical protein, partial [Micromonospora inaquosa]|uniref:hypothetical protein n=1 Tax=Micromonospora inaquosa TaxID=2203716 RepID=UPI001FCA1B0A